MIMAYSWGKIETDTINARLDQEELQCVVDEYKWLYNWLMIIGFNDNFYNLVHYAWK